MFICKSYSDKEDSWDWVTSQQEHLQDFVHEETGWQCSSLFSQHEFSFFLSSFIKERSIYPSLSSIHTVFYPFSCDTYNDVRAVGLEIQERQAGNIQVWHRACGVLLGMSRWIRPDYSVEIEEPSVSLTAYNGELR